MLSGITNTSYLHFTREILPQNIERFRKFTQIQVRNLNNNISTDITGYILFISLLLMNNVLFFPNRFLRVFKHDMNLLNV